MLLSYAKLSEDPGRLNLLEHLGPILAFTSYSTKVLGEEVGDEYEECGSAVDNSHTENTYDQF